MNFTWWPLEKHRMQCATHTLCKRFFQQSSVYTPMLTVFSAICTIKCCDFCQFRSTWKKEKANIVIVLVRNSVFTAIAHVDVKREIWLIDSTILYDFTFSYARRGDGFDRQKHFSRKYNELNFSFIYCCQVKLHKFRKFSQPGIQEKTFFMYSACELL